MNFTNTRPDESFPVLRWVSENNVWEVGIRRMLFGFRVSAGKVGSGCVEIDYCAGSDINFTFLLLATVVQILESLPETVTGQEVKRLFPTYQVKPIDRDPCWKQLQQLASDVAGKNLKQR